MELWVQRALILIGLITVSVGIGLGVTYIACLISERNKASEANRVRQMVHVQIEELSRWCGYEFPIIGEVCDWLEPAILRNKMTVGIDEFRIYLRQKYADQQEDKCKEE